MALVAYVPFLVSSPGAVSSDSKQALYVDPGAFMSSAAYLWDPSVGAGTVPHQHIGYLWPMGPWFWFFEAIGVPTWVAQRLWLGTLTLLAGLGVRWLIRSLGLGRAAAVAGAAVYALSPYQLAFTARTSVLLLPWVGLGWMVELTRRAVSRGGWRHPALFALVTFSVAGVNAASLILVGIGPLAVLIQAAVSGPGPRRTVGAALRLVVLTLPVCVWWLAGLRVQGGYGMPVLQLTENLRTVAERSSPDDVLRGLGNWFFYGSDRAGWSLDQADYYDNHPLAIALSFLVPVLSMAVATVLRWRLRGLVIALWMAMVVAVGAWPYDKPSPAGRLFRAAVESTSAGLAFRNHPRVVPVLVLAMALVLAAGVAAIARRTPRRAAAGVVILAAVAGLAPVVRVGMLTDGMNRPSELPRYWYAAARYLDSQGSSTRVLELPGANFADYRWGNAVEPITPLLIERPYVAREILPYGSPESVLLLDALDRRLQNGVLDPASLAPVARLLGVGSVVFRNDLRFERFPVPGPDSVWNLLVDPLALGLEGPATFGEPTVNAGDPELDALVPSDLSGTGVDRSTPLPPVVVAGVSGTRPVVRVAPIAGSVVLEGDGDGIVDAAAAGLIDGRAMVLLSGAMSDSMLESAAGSGAALVVTDSNRRRIQTWFYSLRDTRGPTEESGETMVEPSGYDERLQTFPNPDDRTRTVVDQLGATVRSTSAGGGASRPEDRPAAAVDGRLNTSWRVGGRDPVGESLTITLDRPTRLDRLVLVQPQDGPRDRRVTKARISVDGAEPIDIAMDPDSMSPDGQMVALPETTARSVTIEITGVSATEGDPATANAVGFAEIGLGRLAVVEVVKMPTDLLGRLGATSGQLTLDLVMTRLRTDPDRWDRHDEELTLERRFELPTARTFALTGLARPGSLATDPVLDQLFGTEGSAQVTSSSRLSGDPEARGSRAFDGDPTTAWVSNFPATASPGANGAWIRVVSDREMTVENLAIDVLADGRHSLPERVAVTVDGAVVATHDVTSIDEELVPGHVSTVVIPVPRGTSGRRVQISFPATAGRLTDGSPGAAALPVGVAEVRGLEVASATTGIVDPDCRVDLLKIDGRGVPLRLSDPAADGRLRAQSCAPIELSPGTHRLSATAGEVSGIDVDQIVLSSDDNGRASTVGTRGVDAAQASAAVTDSSVSATEVTARIQAKGEPFWFVLAQSASRGWEISVDGGSAGPRSLVDGFADGWVITPEGSGPVIVTLRWTPQRGVWAAMLVSLIALLVAATVVLRTQRWPVMSVGSLPRLAPLPWRQTNRTLAAASSSAASARLTVSAGLSTLLLTITVTRPWIALVAGGVSALVARYPRLVWLVALSAATSLALARPLSHPELGWMAVALVAAAVIADVVNRPHEPPP